MHTNDFGYSLTFPAVLPAGYTYQVITYPVIYLNKFMVSFAMTITALQSHVVVNFVLLPDKLKL